LAEVICNTSTLRVSCELKRESSKRKQREIHCLAVEYPVFKIGCGAAKGNSLGFQPQEDDQANTMRPEV
jgi:hypothetical protein